MAGKELDEWTRAAERAEMRLRLKARIARLLEARERPRLAAPRRLNALLNPLRCPAPSTRRSQGGRQGRPPRPTRSRG